MSLRAPSFAGKHVQNTLIFCTYILTYILYGVTINKFIYKLTEGYLMTNQDKVTGIKMHVEVFGNKAKHIQAGDTFIATVKIVEGRRVVDLVPAKWTKIGIFAVDPMLMSYEQLSKERSQ